MNADQICKTLNTLKSLRSPHEQVWRDCFDNTYPQRGNGFYSEMMTAQEALNRKARIFDGTTTDSARTLSSSVQAGMTPANSLWFGMDVAQSTEEERSWLGDSAETVSYTHLTLPTILLV